MYKSNVGIVSNVYIREPKSVSDGHERLEYDPQFIAMVSGKDALKYLKNNYGGSTSGVKLSTAQESELAGDIPCMYGAKGETTHGQVKRDGKYLYECRCEPTNCPGESGCNRFVIIRAQRKPHEEIMEESLPKLEWLGITDDTDVFASPLENETQEVPADEIIEIQEIAADKSDFVKISAEDAIPKIINANIDRRVLINAAPGTGKTYTAIQRLLYVMNMTKPDEFDLILVLCYTRAAVGEIKNRIEKGVIDGTIPFKAKQVSICTVDSLASNYLISLGVDVAGLNYNERIQRFNKEFRRENFASFRYCIIDELQDIVNDRALMALNIVEALTCGYLLLGDKCQAIYDYDCKAGNGIKSTEFYKRLKNLLPGDAERYELIENKRQTSALASRMDELRSALLDFNQKNIVQTFRSEIKKIPVADLPVEKFDFQSFNGTTAILCRSNGEAEYVSWLLHKNNVSHSLLRGAGQSATLKRQIADVLWDYRDKTIPKTDFIKRACIRCCVDETFAQELFNSLSELLFGNIRDYLDIQGLAKRLSHGGELPGALLNMQPDALIVSTIHKAKGREFDRVYLLAPNYSPKYKQNESDTEEERVLYVAETRSKTELEILRKGNSRNWFFKKNQYSRWIRMGKNYKNSYKPTTFCAGFAIGHNEDFDFSHFVNGSLPDAVKRQSYISASVKPGDEVSLSLQDDRYAIIHKSMPIGLMSKDMSIQVMENYEDRQYNYNLPTKITQLYVTNVHTFISHRQYENIPQWFRENRYWLAVEISGFGRTEWNRGKK